MDTVDLHPALQKGLAYVDEIPVNWCPELGTVLANEEVIDGKSERGGYPVIRKPMRQWVLKITDYAERLLEDLELCDWPQSTKEMQINWIGKSKGRQCHLQDQGHQQGIHRVHHTLRYAVRRDLLRHGAGASLCQRDHERGAARSSAGLSEGLRIQVRSGAY